MRLVERHIINRLHPHWPEIDQLAFLSKNLYNLANYHIRQHFFLCQRQLNFTELYHRVSKTVDYRALPTKVSKQIIRQLHQNWTSYFAAVKEYRQCPQKFNAPPKIPRYKHKTKGRNILIYPETAYCKRSLKKGRLKLSMCAVNVPTFLREIVACRIVPATGCYVLEIVYERLEENSDTLNHQWVAGIDLGVNNLMAVASNKRGFQPLLINGRPLKAINQLFNKRKAREQSSLKTRHQAHRSRALDALIHKRNCRVETYLHCASSRVINALRSQGIGTLVIGKNDSWKQEINLGKSSNQTFTNIPHTRLIEMLTYKAQLAGMAVLITEESYTSKASFLDGDPLPAWAEKSLHPPVFSGGRIKRGLYKSRSGILINADLNGAYNIIKKVIPNAWAEGIEGLPCVPVKVNPLQTRR